MELQPIQSKIYEIRGQRVMLDFDLAELYQVETKRLKEAVRRNIERFEGDYFMFVLSEKEYEILRTQIATSSLTSQNASSNWGGRRWKIQCKLPPKTKAILPPCAKIILPP